MQASSFHIAGRFDSSFAMVTWIQNASNADYCSPWASEIYSYLTEPRLTYRKHIFILEAR